MRSRGFALPNHWPCRSGNSPKRRSSTLIKCSTFWSRSEDVEAPAAARVSAAAKVLDRALGKAPEHVDVTALHHTDIVYRSAEELRQELRKALEEEGVPGATTLLRLSHGENRGSSPLGSASEIKHLTELEALAVRCAQQGR